MTRRRRRFRPGPRRPGLSRRRETPCGPPARGHRCSSPWFVRRYPRNRPCSGRRAETAHRGGSRPPRPADRVAAPAPVSWGLRKHRPPARRRRFSRPQVSPRAPPGRRRRRPRRRIVGRPADAASQAAPQRGERLSPGEQDCVWSRHGHRRVVWKFLAGASHWSIHRGDKPRGSLAPVGARRIIPAASPAKWCRLRRARP